jgi:hypothetical protein
LGACQLSKTKKDKKLQHSNKMFLMEELAMLIFNDYIGHHRECSPVFYETDWGQFTTITFVLGPVL